MQDHDRVVDFAVGIIARRPQGPVMQSQFRQGLTIGKAEIFDHHIGLFDL